VADSCVFCEIAADTGRPDVVYADEHAVAFLDHRPLFHGHMLVIPRQHVVTLGDLPRGDVGPFWERVQHLSVELPRLLEAEGSFVANNNIVSQSVAHLHVHVVPRRKGDGLRGFFWPRTRYEGDEAALVAARLRGGIAQLCD
jgi:histidine triad (HIT) family protein